MIKAARELTSQGLRVFPCRSDNKAPLTSNGFKAASTSENFIQYWWGRYPDALIGVPTGDDFVVLDLDLQHAEARWWFERNRERVTPTRVHQTRSGGLHFLFEPHADFKCSQAKIARGVDTRGAGGYVIWWPAHGFAIENENQLAAAPDFIINDLQRQEPIVVPHRSSSSASPSARVRGVVARLSRSAVGERNGVFFWAVCTVRNMATAGELDEPALQDALADIFAAGARVGLPYSEIRKSATSALRDAE
jgi:hypothetical protein